MQRRQFHHPISRKCRSSQQKQIKPKAKSTKQTYFPAENPEPRTFTFESKIKQNSRIRRPKFTKFYRPKTDLATYQNSELQLGSKVQITQKFAPYLILKNMAVTKLTE
jgi:hypothetical protein